MVQWRISIVYPAVTVGRSTRSGMSPKPRKAGRPDGDDSKGAVRRVTVLRPPTLHPSERARYTVRMPVSSVGECRRSEHCRQYMTDLADGLCVAHWDKYMSG